MSQYHKPCIVCRLIKTSPQCNIWRKELVNDFVKIVCIFFASAGVRVHRVQMLLASLSVDVRGVHVTFDSRLDYIKFMWWGKLKINSSINMCSDGIICPSP